jgi:hypothetical protein
VQVAFEWEVDPSSPFGCMGRVVEKDMVAVHLDDSCSVHTYWCYCTSEVAAFVLGDIDPLARQASMAPELPEPEQPYGPGLERLGLVQLVLVAC